MTLAFSSAKTATTAPRIAFAAAIVTLFAAGAQAETTIIPSGAQTADQAGADTTACETQAASQSGYHPSQPAPTASRPAAGQRVSGAARGAAAGAVREERTDKHEREYEDAVGAAPRQVPLLVASDIVRIVANHDGKPRERRRLTMKNRLRTTKHSAPAWQHEAITWSNSK